jgi:hypothetical protein
MSKIHESMSQHLADGEAVHESALKRMADGQYAPEI